MRTITPLFLAFLVVSLSSVSGLLLYPQEPSNHAFAQTSTDITDIGNYAIYGLQNVVIEKNVTINSGNVGVHNASSNMQLPSNSEIIINSDSTFVDPNSAVVGDTIIVKQGVTAQNVFYNELQNDGTILGTQITPLALPVVDSLPDLPISVPGTTSINVPKDSSLTLDAGQYADIFVDKGGTLTLTGGNYNVTSIDAKKDANILFDDTSQVVVQNQIDWAKGVTVGPSATSSITASDIVIFVQGGAEINTPETITELGKDATVHANIYAPNGDIKMSKGTEATGAFIAKTITIDKDSVVTLDSIFGILSVLDELEETVDNFENKGDIFDEAVVVDATSQAINALKDEVNTQVTDPTIKQNLQSILDTALNQLIDAGNSVLTIDEVQANNSIGDAQTTLNSFISVVEAERGIGIPDSVADLLVDDTNDILTDSQKRDIDVITLTVNESSSTVLTSIIQASEDDIEAFSILLDDLRNMGITIELVVEEQSPVKGIIRAIIKNNQIVLIQTATFMSCGFLNTIAISAVADSKGEPLTFDEFWNLPWIHDQFCVKIAEEAFATGDDDLLDQTVDYIFAILVLLDDPFEANKIDVATRLNLPLVKDYWSFEYINFKLGTIVNPDTQLEFQNFFDVAFQTISGKILGFVFEDVDDDGTFNLALGDVPIGGAGILAQNDIPPQELDSTTSAPDGSYVFQELATGDYTVSQNPIAGFEQTVPDPSAGGVYVVSIIAGSIVDSRDFGNRLTVPTLTVIKTVTNDDAGTAVDSDFTISVIGTNASPSSFPGSSSGTTVTLDEGSYRVIETGPNGYIGTYSADCSGTISLGDPKTCTIANDDLPPPTFPINIIDVSPKNGGNACSINNALARDGATAGLDYRVFGFGTGGLGMLPGSNIFNAGCIAADFGEVKDPGAVTVTAGRDGNACGRNCQGSFCSRPTENFHVYSSTDLSSFTFVDRSPTVPPNQALGPLRDYAFSIDDSFRYITVCRSGSGPAASDIMVDSIVIGGFSNTPLPPTPQPGAPYFSPELNQTSINATKPEVVTVPLKVQWDPGYYATPVTVQINNMTSGISSTVTSVQNATHYKLFDMIFNVTSTAQVGEYAFEVQITEISTSDTNSTGIHLNVD